MTYVTTITFFYLLGIVLLLPKYLGNIMFTFFLNIHSSICSLPSFRQAWWYLWCLKYLFICNSCYFYLTLWYILIYIIYILFQCNLSISSFILKKTVYRSYIHLAAFLIIVNIYSLFLYVDIYLHKWFLFFFVAKDLSIF